MRERGHSVDVIPFNRAKVALKCLVCVEFSAHCGSAPCNDVLVCFLFASCSFHSGGSEQRATAERAGLQKVLTLTPSRLTHGTTKLFLSYFIELDFKHCMRRVLSLCTRACGRYLLFYTRSVLRCVLEALRSSCALFPVR